MIKAASQKQRSFVRQNCLVEFGRAVFVGFTIGIMTRHISNWIDDRFGAFDFVRLHRWGLKAGVAILDQGLFSGSNFVLNILAARWLQPEQFGAFSLAFAIYLFVSGFQNALILEPMSVLGTAKYANTIRNYLGGQFVLHIILTICAGSLIMVVGIIMYSFQLGDGFLSLSVIGVGLFLPMMLLMWLARRSCYVAGMPGWALASSLIYSLALIIGLFFLYHQASFEDAIQWYLVIGLASIAGSLAVYLNRKMISFSRLNWKSLLREQWEFGKWIVIAAFLNFAGTQGQLFISAAYLGLDQAGVFRALQNFMLPMLQILTAVSTLSLPSVAYEFGQQAYKKMQVKGFRVALALTFASAGYLILLYIFRNPLDHFFYAGKFAQYSLLIPLTGLIPLITSIETAYSLVVRVLQRPIYYAILTGGIALAGVILGPLLIRWFNLGGALYSLIAVAVTSLVINIGFFYNWFYPIARETDRD